MGRYALLIAAGQYDDPALGQLRAPQQDVDSLAVVLEDPAIGNFSVRTLQDAPDHEVRREIDQLLSDRTNEDLVLLYFSCHGLVDTAHRLHFAAPNTQTKFPASTAISRSFVNEQLEGCRAAAKVLLLDCCFAGAYSEGFKAGSAGALDGQLGSGYVVLSACDTYEYAFESADLVQTAPRGSIFTEVLLEGLRTGAADLDGNGLVSVDELFKYVHDGVVRRRPDQTPKWSAHNAEPHIYLATAAPRGDVAPAVPTRTATSAIVEPAIPRATTGSAHNRHQLIVGRGFRAGSDLIRRVFGPMGRRVLVPDGAGGFVEVADTSSIVRQYRPPDAAEIVGLGYVRDIVDAVHRTAGDGAASAVVLAQAMLERATVALRAGAHPVAMRRGIERAAAAVDEGLVARAVPVQTKEQIAAVAGTASRDEQIGELIAEAIDKVGNEGPISLEPGHTFGLELQLAEGMRLDRGFLSPQFITDPERAEAVVASPQVLVVEGSIVFWNDEIPSPIVVVADDVESQALSMLLGRLQRDQPTVAVKAPGFGDRRRAIREDIAILTGATVVTPAQLQRFDPDVLGRADRVVATADEAVLIGGFGAQHQIQARIADIERELATSDSEYDREKLQERLAKLAGGVAIIRISAPTAAALAERMAKAEAGVRVARAAVEQGVVAGGGATLARLGVHFTVPAGLAPDEATGFQLVLESLSAPFKELVGNAGEDATALLAQLTLGPRDRAFDVRAGSFVDAFPHALIDPVAAIRAGVQAATAATVRYVMVA